METTLSITEDSLIDSLSFRLPSTANYITSREDVTYFPANGNIFSPQGTKIMRFMLTGGSWLDPRSVRIQFTVNNTKKNPMWFINSLPQNFCRRLRILANGTLIEDIDFYNRVCNMLHVLYPVEKRLNDQVEGLGTGNHFDDGSIYTSIDSFNDCPKLEGNQSRVVLFPLMCGLFTQEKYLPLRYLSLQIELEVVNNYTDCVLAHVDYTNEPAAVSDTGAISTEWTISEAQIKCSTIELDSQLDNEYTDHLMSGKNIPIPLSTFSHSVQTIGATDRPTLSMSRAFTRLNKVFVTFYRVPYVWTQNTAMGADKGKDPPEKTNELALHKPLRELNYFTFPSHVYDYGTTYNTNNEQSTVEPFKSSQGRVYLGKNSEVELQLQIGSKVIPVLPSRSLAEQFYMLRKAVMGGNNTNTQFNITDGEYRTYKYINCFDLQKVPGAFASGLSTRTGDLITIKCLNLQHYAWNIYCDFVHATFHHDIVMSITDAGVTVLE